MAKLAFTMEIVAPPERVFLFFVPQRMPDWYGAEIETCFEVQGGAAEFEVGLKVRISGRVGKKDLSHTAVVTRYESNRLLEWRFQDAYGVRGLQCWQLDPIPANATPRGPVIPSLRSGQALSEAKDPSETAARAGSPSPSRGPVILSEAKDLSSAAAPATRLHMRDEYQFPGRIGRLADWLLTRHAVARRDRAHLDRLKLLAERV